MLDVHVQLFAFTYQFPIVRLIWSRSWILYLVALCDVTGLAGCHDVFPRGLASTRYGYHMVQGQFLSWQFDVAVLAGV